MTASTPGLARTGHPGEKRGFRLPLPSERLLFALAGFVVVLSIWEAASFLGLIKKVTLSAPSIIVGTFFEDMLNGVIIGHVMQSGQYYLLGLGLGLITGIPLGLAFGLFRRLNYIFDPWLSAIYATPTIALVPLIVIIFGLGIGAKIFIVWLEAIFVITVSVIGGVRAADQRHLDLAKSFGASSWLRFRSVIVPTSVPFILTGVRLGATRAIVGVVVAEFFASNSGIGFYINFSGTILRTDRVYVGIILLGLLGIAIGEIIRRVEQRFEEWRPAIN